MRRLRPSSQLHTTLQPRMSRVEVQFGLSSNSTLGHHIVSSAVLFVPKGKNLRPFIKWNPTVNGRPVVVVP
jgi:hypothetical protein